MTVFSDRSPVVVNFPTNQFQSPIPKMLFTWFMFTPFISAQCESLYSILLSFTVVLVSLLSSDNLEFKCTMCCIFERRVFLVKRESFHHTLKKNSGVNKNSEIKGNGVKNSERMRRRGEGSETTDNILTVGKWSASHLTFIVCRSISLCSPSERSLQVVVLLGKLL